jgi:exodeoxyribonuclease VII small subunit
MSQQYPSNKDFRAALAELENIVEELESGELTLESSLDAFERGVGLVKFCNQTLNAVEKKVEMLVKDKDGQLQLKVFEALADAAGDKEDSD